MMRTRVKICGITRRQDALTAAELGADAIGFVFYSSSPRFIDVTGAQKIAQCLPPFITKVGLFVNAVAGDVRETGNLVGLDLLQFHGDEDAEFCRSFDLPYLKAIRMQDNTNISMLANQYHDAAGFLLDSYVADQAGGTGQVFDWRKIPAGLSRPVVLAGGLTPENVGSAIKQVKPYAVDVSSGVEQRPGIKDTNKISEFMKAVRNSL
jgi:phosphoribosylanthranilate isomerase